MNGNCEFCDGEADFFGPDPFLQDVHGDDTPYWLCDTCAHDRAMEI